MTTSISTRPSREHTDATWLRLVQIAVAVGVVALVDLAIVMMFFTTVSEGSFRYDADYWLTSPGLPLAVLGAVLTLGVHQLQHGADGRLGAVGAWLNVLAMTELFLQLVASLIQGAEVRWGPAYPVSVLVSFVGVALLAAGSWRTGLLPKWMLGVWPLIWVLGGFAATGPTPLLLAAFLVALAVTLTTRVHARAG